MAQKKHRGVNSSSNTGRTSILVAVIGLVSVVAAALIGYLATVETVERPIEATLTSEAVSESGQVSAQTEPIQITFESSNEIMPSFSPDSKLVTFISDRDGNAEIYLMYADGMWPRRLTVTDAGEDVPTFSPDGTEILFGANYTGDDELFLISLDGANVVNISNAPSSNEGRGRFSPTGKLVVFDSDRTGNWEIHFTELVEGVIGETSQVTFRPEHGTRYPSISQLGDLIYFRSGSISNQEDGMSDIFSIRLDGSNLRPISTDFNDYGPVISVDGQWLAFVSDRAGNPEIYALHMQQGTLVRITDHPADDSSPSWSYDGKWLIFSSNRGGTGYDIYKVPFVMPMP